jgi:uncharacterized SAM-binding protein YcdF (DUF218 family)
VSPWSGDAEARDDEAYVAAKRRQRRRSRVRSIWRWIVAILVLAILAPPVLGTALIGSIYWQARTDETRPVDAIIVLGAAQYNGRPTSVLRARLDHVLTLYDEGYAPFVVVTGGKQEGDVTTEAEASRDYLVEHGVPATSILMENEGRDTWQSLQGVAGLLKERELSRVLLVSDGFHLLRAKMMARDLGLKAFASAADGSPIRPGSGREFGYVVREAVAIVAYAVKSVL